MLNQFVQLLENRNVDELVVRVSTKLFMNDMKATIRPQTFQPMTV
jgi:hypothetical protein